MQSTDRKFNAWWILATLALFFVGDRLGGAVLESMVESSQFRYSKLLNDTGEADILLVGNSRGLMFYQPYIEETTGKNTLNLSYNGMPMNLAAGLVEDYFERYPAPEVMVLDVTMCDRENLQLIRDFRTYAAKSDRLSDLLREEAPRNYWGAKFSHLYRYNSEIFQRALYYRNRSDEDWLLDRVINDRMVAGIDDTEDYTITMVGLEELKKTVELAQSKGTEVRLVINPYYPPFAQKIQNLTQFRRTVTEATGLEVADYSLAVADTQGFGDYQHLNKAGSRAYIDRLLADGVLW